MRLMSLGNLGVKSMAQALGIEKSLTFREQAPSGETSDGALYMTSSKIQSITVGSDKRTAAWPAALDQVPANRQLRHFQTPPEGVFAVPSNGVEFSQLIQDWHTERGETSSISDMAYCPSYLRIIGMGSDALPLIFAQLRRESNDPDHWFVALEAITGEDPVPTHAYGDTAEMSAAWLSWANARGF